MSDLISRQDAINTALEFFVEFLGGAFHEDDQKILMKRMNELPSAQPESHWIPCSEKPDRHGRYLTTCSAQGITWQDVVNYGISNERPEFGVSWFVFDDEYGCVLYDNTVVAWMPLPEPYKERRTDE